MTVAPAETQVCIICKRDKPLIEFGWSKRRRAPTKRCIACWTAPNRDKGSIPLLSIYAELMILMDNIRGAKTFEQLVKEEWDEHAMRLVMRGLLLRASEGDREAAKLILDVRLKLKAQGDGSEEDVLNLAQLLASDPLITGGDTE